MAEVIPIDRGRTEPGRSRCRATTTTGRPCRNNAVDESGYCHLHGGAARARHPSGTRIAGPGPALASDSGSVRELIARRAAAAYEVDEFGLDEDLYRNVPSTRGGSGSGPSASTGSPPKDPRSSSRTTREPWRSTR